MANIRYAKYPKNQKVLQTSENRLYHGEDPICQISEKPKSAANIRKAAFPGQTSDMSDIRKTKKCCIHAKTSFTRAKIRYVKHPKKQKMLQTSENQLYHGEHPICQISENPKSAANIRKPALSWRRSDMPNIRKTKKCCKHPKSSFSRANIRYVRHPKNQKVLHTCENQLYQGKHPICQTSEKPKNAANIRKPALSWRTSDMPNIRKTKKCCKHPKTGFIMAKIRYAKYPKNQKVLQTSEKQLFQGKHPICQTSEKPKSAAYMRKPALPGQRSDMSNIRKNKKCCKHPKSSFSRANIRCVKHPKNQNVVQTSENQLYQGKHPICQTSEKSKSLQTSEKQLFQGKHPICQTSEKTKSAAYMRKPALPGQRSDMSNIRKNKKCCKHPKSSFSRANIRCVKHPKNQNVVQTSENQLYQGKHPICQTSEKPKSAASIRKPALPWKTSDMPNIRKTKKCCKHPKSSFSRANFRYVKHSKNLKVLQSCKNQLYQGKHPIFHTSEKPKSAANMRKPALRGQTPDTSNIQKLKSAANIRKAAFPGQTSDMSNIRKTKNCCNYSKTSFNMPNIRYAKHPKNQKRLQTSEKQLFQGKPPEMSNIR